MTSKQDAADKGVSGAQRVTIVHMSDTHNMHRHIHELPNADILIHTGDFTQGGSDEELKDFDAWLGEIKSKFRYIVVILGNHDWHETQRQVASGKLSAKTAVDPNYMRSKFSNCILLQHQEVTICGLRIFGSSWTGWNIAGAPQKVDSNNPGRRMMWEATGLATTHRFKEIPAHVDILLTHGPAYGILDCVGNRRTWGSCAELIASIQQAKPKVHLFGHLHEQRGLWRKEEGKYVGGVEYRMRPELQPFETHAPPPSDYPCELICNTAMCNHEGLEGVKDHLAGSPRLIVANSVDSVWTFSTKTVRLEF